jgi:tetratricopeptide (TPR) repeat protein
MSRTILIAHAENEEALADLLADPLRKAGYDVAHRGTVVVGESVTGEASRILGTGAPVVLCGTVRAMGTRWARHVVNAATPFTAKRVFPVRMEQYADLESVLPDVAVAEYWRDGVQAIGQLVAALRASFPPDAGDSPYADETVLKKYLTAIRGKSADLPDAYKGEGFRSLTEIYTPQLLEEKRESNDSGHLPARLAATGRDSGGIANPATPIFELIDKARTHHLIIEGGPGAGKSTCLRFVAHELARRWLGDQPISSFPIPIPAAAFSAGLDRPLSALLHGVVTTELGAEWQDAMFPLELFAVAPARESQWLVLVDGLDTVHESSERQRILTAIQNRDPSGLYRFVLTSRPVNELGASAQSSWSSYRLMPFDPNGLSEFARAWFKSDAQKSDAFVAALSQAELSELGRIPLLATVAASVFERNKGLQGTRASLYEEFVQLMLRLKPEQQQSAKAVLRRLKTAWAESLESDGSKLAAELFAARRRAVGFLASRQLEDADEPLIDSALRFVREQLAHNEERRLWLSNVEDVIARNLLPEFMSWHGLITERAGRHHFIHDSFREYLAAVVLADNNPPLSDRARALLARWHDPVWREVLLFMFARWSEHGHDVSELVREIGSSAPELSFAGFAIAEGARVSPDLERDILSKLLRIARFTSRGNVLESILALAQRSNSLDRLLALAADPTVEPTQRYSISVGLMSTDRRPAALNILRGLASAPDSTGWTTLLAIEQLRTVSPHEANELARRYASGDSHVFTRIVALAGNVRSAASADESLSDQSQVLEEVRNFSRHTPLLAGFGITMLKVANVGPLAEEWVRSTVANGSSTVDIKASGWAWLAGLGHKDEAERALADLLHDPSLDAAARNAVATKMLELDSAAEAEATLAAATRDTSLEAKDRIAAAQALGQRGRSQSVEPMLSEIARFADHVPDRLAAAKALSQLGLRRQSVECFKALAERPTVEPALRIEAANALDQAVDINFAVQCARSAARDSRSTPADRLAAAELLGKFGLMDQMEVELEGLLPLATADVQVRLKAAQLLVHVDRRDTGVRFLKEAANRRSFGAKSRVDAATKLLELGYRADAEPVLAQLAGSLLADRPDRVVAAGYLASAGRRDEARFAIEALILDCAIEDSFYDLENVAIKASGLGLHNEARAALTTLSTRDHQASNKEYLGKALHRLGFLDDAREALMSVVTDPKQMHFHRTSAAEALHGLGLDGEVVAVLLTWGEDETTEAQVVVQISKTLSGLGQAAEAAKLLRNVLTDARVNDATRIGAADALRSVDPSIDVLTDMRSIASDDEADIDDRIRAAGILAKQGEGAGALALIEPAMRHETTRQSLSMADIDGLMDLGAAGLVEAILVAKLRASASQPRSYQHPQALAKLEKFALIGPATAILLEMVTNQGADISVVKWALDNLDRLGRKSDAVAVALSVLDDPETSLDRRIDLVQHLLRLAPDCKDRIAAASLVDASAAASRGLKQKTASTLWRMGASEPARAILNDLATAAGSPTDRLSAATTLVECGFLNDALLALRLLVADPAVHASTRLNGATMLSRAGVPTEARDLLLALIGEPELPAQLLIQAVTALAEIGFGPDGPDRLVGTLRGASMGPGERIELARALADCGANDAAVEFVRVGLSSSQVSARVQVDGSKVLADLGLRDEAAQLLRGSGSADLRPSDHFRAIVALYDLGFTDEAVAAVRALIEGRTGGEDDPMWRFRLLADDLRYGEERVWDWEPVTHNSPPEVIARHRTRCDLIHGAVSCIEPLRHDRSLAEGLRRAVIEVLRPLLSDYRSLTWRLTEVEQQQRAAVGRDV